MSSAPRSQSDDSETSAARGARRGSAPAKAKPAARRVRKGGEPRATPEIEAASTSAFASAAPVPAPAPPIAAAGVEPSLLLAWEESPAGPRIGFRGTAGPAGAPASPEPANPPVDTSRPILFEGDSHLATFAPTGAGKGRGVIIPTLLTYPGPVVVIDPKGENYQVTARRRRELGQRVVVLDPFRIVTADGESDALNPLDIFDLEGVDPEGEAEMLASMLSVGHEYTTDRYWNDTGTALLSGLLAHIVTNNDGEGRSLNRLRKFLYHDDLDYQIAVWLDSKSIKSPLARDEFVSYLSAPSDKTRPCIRSTASTYVKALGSASVAKTLESSTFDLRDVVFGAPLSVYIVIPPEKLESHRSLLRLWVGALLTAITRRRRLPERRTLFLLDECGQLGTFPALRQAITLLRGYGMQVWSFWQDLSQLKLLYPLDWQTILNNSAVIQVFGVNNYQMSREWSDVIGLSPSDLTKLKPEQAAVAIQGSSPRVGRRPDYLFDPPFAGLFDANPRFEKPSEAEEILYPNPPRATRTRRGRARATPESSSAR